ncbi:MAG: DHH family phosphoesterase [Turicibacter sp.]|nr:DHH family phosphoesterase [Turicibacter sp.]
MKEKWNSRYELVILATLNIVAITAMMLFGDGYLFAVILLLITPFINLAYFIFYNRRKSKLFLNEKKTIAHRVKEAGEYVFDHLPLGILLYDEDDKVVWSNAHVKSIFRKDVDNLEILDIDNALYSNMKATSAIFEYKQQDLVYQVEHKKKERVLYFDDITTYAKLLDKYNDEKATLGLIVMDNYDEVVKNLDEQEQNDYRRAVVDELSRWASSQGILFRTLRDGRYLIMMTHKTLESLCENKFAILDDIRAIGTDEVTLTVSIGIASGYESSIASFNRASSLVDLSLSRGGDQVVIKKKGIDDFMFYGGKTNPIASQNRVRARVNAGAYERLVLDSDNVVIMGHRFPDADAIGASIGLLRIAMSMGKEAYIILNKSELDKANAVFIGEILKDEKLASYFISSIKAVELMTKNSLLVIADTQDANLVIDKKLLRITNKVAIFDHHRRGVSHIDATLSYTDPSVSSTSELVVDMLDYFKKRIDLSVAEASIMLSGIMLDTRRFMYNTSKKTYDAAAILKQKGADEKYVSKLLKAPIDHYYSRAHLTHRARVFEAVYLISEASDDRVFDRTEIAATADDLLNVQGIKATFVLGKTSENEVSISARSVGEVNVQLMMEAIGGGGHLTNAAARFEGEVSEAVQALEAAIKEYD